MSFNHRKNACSLLYGMKQERALGASQVSSLVEGAGQREQNPDQREKETQMEINSLKGGQGLRLVITKASQETAFVTIWLNKVIHSSFCLTRAAGTSWAHPMDQVHCAK